MGHDTVKVHTTQLHDTSHTAKNGATDTHNLSNDVGSALSDLATALSAVDVLANLAGTLESFGTNLMATLACFATGLHVIDNGLAISATAFTGLDATLVSTFTTLENQLGYYTAYGTTFTMPAIHPASGPITLSTTTLSYQTAVHHSFWGSVGGFFSSVGHFIAHHALQVGVVLGVATIIAGGILLTPFTGGGSDVAAGAGAAALLAAA